MTILKAKAELIERIKADLQSMADVCEKANELLAEFENDWETNENS